MDPDSDPRDDADGIDAPEGPDARLAPATAVPVPGGRQVLVVGDGGEVGRRVVALLLARADVARVVGVDVLRARARDGRYLHHHLDIEHDDLVVNLDGELDGIDSVIHLAFSSATETHEARARAVNLGGTARVLGAATKAGACHITVLSSATVYGAWEDNPIPLTEDAPLRPNPEFLHAVQREEVERLCERWASDAPDRTVAVLRPTTALSADGSSWLAASLAAAAGVRVGPTDPPAQFVSLDDVAAALVLAWERGLTGPYNVAPDGWVAGEIVRQLARTTPRLTIPPNLAPRIANLSWRLRRGPIPPGLLPYTMHPWVVSNDRIEAAGWTPTATNEEAYVAGTEGSWWSMISPKRKQELALGLSGLLLALAAGTVGVILGRWRRARR